MKKSLKKMLAEGAENDNEPMFTIRAKDKAAVPALVAYFEECNRLGSPNEHLAGIVEITKNFTLWQAKHKDKTKIPD